MDQTSDWYQILQMMIRCCSQVYSWFTQLLMGIGEGVNGPWYTIFGIMCAMLGTRFILYPFLKGRVVGGIGEEFRSSSDYHSLRSIENKWDDNAGRYIDRTGNYTNSRWS